jgi:hypothetical protein
MSVSDAAKARAKAAFKRKEDQARDGADAWAEYEAKSRAIAENMRRLRAPREQLQDLLQPQIYPVYPFDMPDLQPASSGNIGI